MKENSSERGLDQLLNKVDYSKLGNYRPGIFALKFIEFVKLVNDGKPENISPLFHYQIMDAIQKYPNTLHVAFRGSAKTSLVEYMILYIAVFGKIDGFGDIKLGMYVGDTHENGVKNMRNNLEFRYDHSEFLKKFVPKVKFTDPEWEFTNCDGHEFTVRGFGMSTGVRGFKKYGVRPQICHARGSVVTTDIGTHRVEDYYKKGNSIYTRGIEVGVCGLVDKEIVTQEHKFMAVDLFTTRRKEYVKTVDVCGYVNKTISSTSYRFSECGWCMAKDLAIKEKIGNQTYANTYLMKKIDRKEEICLPMLLIKDGENKKYGKLDFMKLDEYGWFYGYYLANGTSSRNRIGFVVRSSRDDTVGARLRHVCEVLGLKLYGKIERSGCYSIELSCVGLARHYNENHIAHSVKNIPDYVLRMPISWQRQLLLGYIAGDGYVTQEQVRINSVNKDVIIKLGLIAERIGLPYHIRWTRTKEIDSSFPNGYVCISKKQWEIRFKDNVKEVLGFEVVNNEETKKEVFIQGNHIYRKVKSANLLNALMEFIPIQTPSNTYNTAIATNHNCYLDDVLTDKNAESKTVTNDIENTIYKAIRQAMHPKKRRIIWIGTPFNMRDPLYKAAGSNSWHTTVWPICQEWPCEKKDFISAWPDRFTYEVVRDEYEMLRGNGRVDAFNQELMLRILGDEDRLVLDEDIVWYKRSEVLSSLGRYNVYITTDFATSETEKSDYSVISVWALGVDGKFRWIDGIVKRQNMANNVNDLFRLAKLYNPLSVGIEISGQQRGFVSWIRKEMTDRGEYFHIASDKATGEEGLRPNTSKLARFNTALPLFKQRKILFPEELKDSAALLEFITEITSVTPGGFKSMHDDCADTVSQLTLIEYFVPGIEENKEQKAVFNNEIYYYEVETPSYSNEYIV